ncbi:hypothetical protein DY120_07350 [Apilactobacillus micheneri]|uniref:Uncharacterized protein n=1 Tax=Apilactobacillus micheneri TaxID=1899430 RepID=A0ABY2YV04_9LACO|nr:hypothetical protein [Apilactobacillus micheneri]TPR23114.1 hypothetical protein DY114_07335 [Apilactobacillus micheneri]TPR24432.1 hypothetical protein DY111_07350 [Apilactobacillus micheneri]TPR29379.1 hypothetical protein DY120_07350 [Apilactobacillus micheneri]TPR34586.1 hypothetical protein DY027_07340 [Apilactobacillus micheneri]
MNINDLNIKLQNKKPSNITKAVLNKDGNTEFYNEFDEFQLMLYKGGQLYFPRSESILKEFFEIVSPYLKTTPEKRKSDLIYYVILGADMGVYTMYKKTYKDDKNVDFKICHVTPDEISMDYKFSYDDLQKLYSFINDKYNKRYAHIAEWSTVLTSEVNFESQL